MTRQALSLALCILIGCAATPPAPTAHPVSVTPSADPAVRGPGSAAPGAGQKPASLLVAECLAAKQAKLYGNCYVREFGAQVKVFGDAIGAVPLVMCLTCMESYGANAECHANKIQDYPTWIFADGTRVTGVLTLGELVKRAGCKF